MVANSNFSVAIRFQFLNFSFQITLQAVILTALPVLLTIYVEARTTRSVCSTEIGVAKANNVLTCVFKITMQVVILTRLPVLLTDYVETRTTRLVCSTKIGVAKANSFSGLRV